MEVPGSPIIPEQVVSSLNMQVMVMGSGGTRWWYGRPCRSGSPLVQVGSPGNGGGGRPRTQSLTRIMYQ